MRRLLTTLVSISCCTSCVDNPYLSRSSQDTTGKPEYVFAYGRFCGPDNPVLRRAGENGLMLTELHTLWPPIDDMDAVCYAHDYCVQRAPSMLCDSAFTRTLSDFQQDFSDPRCFNLAHDMWTAIHLHSARGSPDFATGAPILAGLSRLMLKARSTTDEFPEEGACNLVTRSNPDMILDAFEYHFDKSRASYSDIDLNISRAYRSDDDATE